MTVRLKARGSDGRVAIWRDGSDEAPFNNPLAHLDRVLFHSDLDYPAIIATYTGTLNLPARVNSEDSINHKLFAHGLAGIPFVLGYATINGYRVPFAGSVPISMDIGGVGRWLNLGADTTHVCIHEVSAARSTGHPAMSVNWTVFVTDTIVS